MKKLGEWIVPGRDRSTRMRLRLFELPHSVTWVALSLTFITLANFSWTTAHQDCSSRSRRWHVRVLRIDGQGQDTNLFPECAFISQILLHILHSFSIWNYHSNLSIQYILNCGTEDAGSCHGGYHTSTYEFIKKVGYVPYDTCNPYIACSNESTDGEWSSQQRTSSTYCCLLTLSSCHRILLIGRYELFGGQHVPYVRYICRYGRQVRGNWHFPQRNRLRVWTNWLRRRCCWKNHDGDVSARATNTTRLLCTTVCVSFFIVLINPSQSNSDFLTVLTFGIIQLCAWTCGW